MKGLNNIPSSLYIIIIIAIALLLRLFGIWHDYPYSFYPDEAHFVKRSLSFGSGDLNPHWFHKPAFFMYLLFFEYGVFYIIGRIFSVWSSTQDFAVSFITNPGPFYIIGRLTVTAFSIATIYTVYQLCKKHINSETGLYAALLLTFSLGHIATSQNVKADIPAAFFALLSAYYLLSYIDSKSNKHIIFSAIVAGIGAATKIYPYVMLAPIFMSIAVCYGYPLINLKRNIKKILLLGITVIISFYSAFFICSPFNFLDPLGLHSTFGGFIKLYNSIINLFGGETAASANKFITAPVSRGDAVYLYVKSLISNEGMGYIIGSISIIGFLYMLKQKNYKYFVTLLFPLIFIIISTIVYPGYAETRHQIPIYPFLVIAGGFLLYKLRCILGQNVIIGFLAAGLIIPSYFILERASYISKTDTRNIAKHWIESTIPKDSKIVLDEYGPVLFMNEQQLNMQMEIAQSADKNGQFTAHYGKYLKLQLLAAKKSPVTYRISEIRFPWWREKEPAGGTYYLDERDKDMGNPLRPVGVKKLEQYREEGYKYVIVSSRRYNPFFIETTHRFKYFPSFRNFYHELFKNGELIKEFNPADDGRPGPIIRVYKI